MKSSTSKIKSFAKKWLPLTAGVSIALITLIILNNNIIIARYINSTGDYIQDTTVLDTDSEKNINKDENKIIINSINITAPIDFSLEQVNEDMFQASLQKGVTHYPGTAKPDENGNTVIFGHSSGRLWTPGDYKFIFTNLDKLQTNDSIIIHYEGTSYNYQIEETLIVVPSDMSVLQSTNKRSLTLITCHPVGSNAKRLIIKAKLLNNDDAYSTPNQVDIHSSELPGKDKPLWESIKTIFTN